MQRPTRKRPKSPLDHEPEAVLYARKQAGLTHQQLADRCGVSKSLITEIENGTRNATPPMIRKLAAALNCPRVILERKREPEAPPSPSRGVRRVRNEERTVTPELQELPQAAVKREAS